MSFVPRTRSRFTLPPLCLAAVLGVLASAPPAMASAPTPVPAYYMYGTSASAINTEAYNDACTFATDNPNADEVMVLDFGQPYINFGNGHYGAYDFGKHRVENSEILTAMESASNGIHDCRKHGTNTIVYGANNSYLDSLGYTVTNMYDWGEKQVYQANKLETYDTNNNRTDQYTGVGVDMEPDWATHKISNALVNGANEIHTQLDWNYGSPDGCKSDGSCDNGWTEGDVGWGSFSGLAMPIPEVYDSGWAPKWVQIAQTWDSKHSTTYFFGGVTGSSGVSQTPTQSWNDLSNAFSGTIERHLLSF